MRILPDRSPVASLLLAPAVLLAGCASLPELTSLGPSAAVVAPEGETGAAGQASSISTGAIPPRPDIRAIRELAQKGQRGPALAQLRQASAAKPLDRSAALDLGTLALELEDAQLATELLTVADDPQDRQNWRLLSARGMALALQGRYRDARSLFEQASRIAPDNPSVLNNLAMALTAEGEASQAERILRRALDKRPADGRIRDNLALVLALQGRDSEARTISEGLFERS